MSGQFNFLGRHRPHSLQVAEMDQHQNRNYSTSEQFTSLGRRRPGSPLVINTGQHWRGNYATSEQFTYLGRNFNAPDISVAQARGNLARGSVHSHYHSNPENWSNVHHASNFSSDLPSHGQTLSGPPSVAPRYFAGYANGTNDIDTSAVAGRFSLKRRSPDGPMVLDQGNSNQGPYDGSSSMPGLLDSQFDDNQNISQYGTSFQQYSRGSYPNSLNDSGRNVRSGNGPNLVPTPITSQHVHATNVPGTHSVAINNPHTNANASAAWNPNFVSSNVPGRTVSETNGINSEANQFPVRIHGVEGGQYSCNYINGRNVIPPSQYVEVYENSIRPQASPTWTWGSNSLSCREHTRPVGDGYEATSNYNLQPPAETDSLRYSWSPYTQMWRTSYQNDRARGTPQHGFRVRYWFRARDGYEAPQHDFRARYRFRARYGYEATSSDHHLQLPVQVYSTRYSDPYTTATGPRTYQGDGDRSTYGNFLSHEPAMNRNGSMEAQHVIQGDILTYFPPPRGADVSEGDMFTYFPPPRGADVREGDTFTYIPPPRGADLGQGDMFTYFPPPRGVDVRQGEMFTYYLPPRGADVRQGDMFTYFPPPRGADMRQGDIVTYSPPPRGAELRLGDMFTYFPPPRDGDTYANDEYEAMRLDIGNMSYEELLALEEYLGNVKTGLSEDEISNCLVESSNYASEKNKEESICPICLDDSNMDKVMKLRSCGHEFHLQCVTKWLEMKNVCPMCKTSVASDS